MSDQIEAVSRILKQYAVKGLWKQVEKIPTGHINATYRVDTKSEQEGPKGSFLLQQINQKVFSDPWAVMQNIRRVTTVLQNGSEEMVLPYYLTEEGQELAVDEDGGCWRLTDYLQDVMNGSAYLEIGGAKAAEQIGVAYGAFSYALRNADPGQFTEVLPHFHDLSRRFHRLPSETGQGDPRAKKLLQALDAEISFVETEEQLLHGTKMPLRVVHNDAKPDNLLFLRKKPQKVTVIDLDTCMPGYLWQDFGDLVRSVTCQVKQKGEGCYEVSFRKNLFQSLAAGFGRSWGGELTPQEMEAMAYGGASLSLELSIRYLEDYLTEGEYFQLTPEEKLQKAEKQYAVFQTLRAQTAWMKEELLKTY